MKTLNLFTGFFESEKSGGLLLIFATLTSLALANCPIAEHYISFWHTQIGPYSIEAWINDGLMSIFFLLIGLELEREIYFGELSSLKNAALPFIGALGGMIVPACIYIAFNAGTPDISGAGIPMATDIAFAIGILSLLGNRVPTALKVFLTALAVIDDLGAIIIIAVFYTSGISMLYLAGAIGVWIILFILNRMKVHALLPYLAGGIVLWWLMMQSGVHPTIAGVILAFAIPFGDGGDNTASSRLQNWLHIPVAFIILPLFALANTAIAIDSRWTESLFHLSSVGIIAGLLIGKPLGIFAFSFFGEKMKLCRLPDDLQWKHIFGAGILGGIGFTMSIFIAMLAFEDKTLIIHSKIAILAASFLAGISGYAVLKIIFRGGSPAVS